MSRCEKVDLDLVRGRYQPPRRIQIVSISLEGTIIVGIETLGATTVGRMVPRRSSFIFNKITFRDERHQPEPRDLLDLVLGRKC